MNIPITNLHQGLQRIKNYVATLAQKPGVYRMIDHQSNVLYVGKAKNLKKRVHSYTQPQKLPDRLKRMIAETHIMEFVITRTEVEALLLEATLIKNLKPRYNILLKDSKFFAFIMITEHSFPQLKKHRGAKTQKGRYFGPFASTESVNNTITSLHKIFRLRNCTDSFFKSRTRPCLQYHIKRCTAPCVDYISPQDYQASVSNAIDFLEGKSSKVQRELSDKMMLASTEQDYEKAIVYRNQIEALTRIQAYQGLSPTFITDTDVIVLAREGHTVAIQIFLFRKGSPYGNHTYYPERTEDLNNAEILTNFITLFYDDRPPPEQILINHPLDEKALIEQALKQKYHKKVWIAFPTKGEKKKLLDRANENALDALQRHIATLKTETHLLEDLAKIFRLSKLPQRIEVYDNSHIQGKDSIGAMIVATPKGFDKKSYKKFNIKTIESQEISGGDDFGMMREVISRRFTSQKEDFLALPDLMLIDGGKGQLNVVHKVLKELDLDIPVVAISKGPDRNAGQETFHQQGTTPFSLETHKPLLYYLQRLRDEAHRFAIFSHRAKRAKNIQRSPLDEIPGIGPQRKKNLLRHFGSTRNIMDAGVEDLKKLGGISASLAQKIYDFFHP